MKKYLALALLTATGINSLQAVKIGGGGRKYAQAAAGVQGQALAEKHDVEAQTLAAAAVALAVATGTASDTSSKLPEITFGGEGFGEGFEVPVEDGSTIPLATEEELGATMMLTKATRATIQEAEKKRRESEEFKKRRAAEQEELDRQKAALVATLETGIVALSEKVEEAHRTVSEKQKALELVKAEKENALADSQAKQAAEIVAQENFEAAQRQLEAATQAKQVAENDLQAKTENELARSNSFNRHQQKAQELDEDKAAVEAQLLKYNVPAEHIAQLLAKTPIVLKEEEVAAATPATQPSSTLGSLFAFFGLSPK